MARLFLRIQVNKENADSVPMIIESDDIENNVSSLLINRTSVEENNGSYGMSFGGRNKITGEQGWLSLSGGYLGGPETTLRSEETKYSGFMFGVTDSEGRYELSLEISGGEIEKVVIIGDKAAGQFPIEAYLDNSATPIYSDDNNWAIKFPSEAERHIIRFTRWSKADYNACFTTLKILATNLDLNKAYIDNLDTLTQSSSDATSIQNAILPNSGTVNIADVDGELRDYFEDGIIENSNVPVEIWLNGKKIRSHITTDSDYEENTMLLKLQMTNDISKLDNITYKGRALTSGITAYELFKEVLGGIYSYQDITNALSNKIVFGSDNKVGTVKQYLSTIYIQYPYLEQDTYRNTINKLCDMTQLQCYYDENNKISFVSSRPIAVKEEIESAVRIRDYNAVDNLTRSVILKNKYDGISGDITNVKEEIDVNALLNNITVETFTEDTSYTQKGGQSKIYFNADKQGSLPAWKNSYRGTATYLCNTYMKATVRVKKLQNMNTIDIQKIYSYIDNGIKFSVTSKKYNKERASTEITYTFSSSEQGQMLNGDFSKIITNDNFVYTPITTYDSEKIIEEDISIDNSTPTPMPEWFEDNVTSKVELSDKQTATVRFDEDAQEYIIEYVARIGSYGCNYSGWNLGWDSYGSALSSFSAILSGPAFKTEPIKLEISLYGTKKEFKFDSVDISSSNVESAKTIATINGSEIFQKSSTISGQSLIEQHKQNILSDYSNGVPTANINVFPDDFTNSTGDKVVCYSKGELIEPNKIVFFDNDLNNDGSQKYWRVKGSHFVFNTEPITQLEVQGVVGIYDYPEYTITWDSNYIEVKDENNNKLTSGSKLKSGSKIKVISGHTSEDYKWTGIIINGKRFDVTDAEAASRIVELDVLSDMAIQCEYSVYEQKEFNYTSADNSNDVTIMRFNPNNVDIKSISFYFNNDEWYVEDFNVTDDMQYTYNSIVGTFGYSKTYFSQQCMELDNIEITSAYNKPMKIVCLMYSNKIVE